VQKHQLGEVENETTASGQNIFREYFYHLKNRLVFHQLQLMTASVSFLIHALVITVTAGAERHCVCFITDDQ